MFTVRGERRGKDSLYITCFHEFTGIQTNKMLITFLCLIATLSSVSGDCDNKTHEKKFFDWDKVRISVLTRIIQQAAVKTSACVLYFICGSINELSIEHIRL
jgi:hypothetical protein